MVSRRRAEVNYLQAPVVSQEAQTSSQHCTPDSLPFVVVVGVGVDLIVEWMGYC